ncbi:MAG: DUF4239 domain-containing protein [Rickettsiales bacterium]|nr:DUF4239 domain-containing protein [Rickettsiales bacterium]
MIIDFLSSWHVYLTSMSIAVSLSLLFHYAFSKVSISFARNMSALRKASFIANSINTLYALLIGFVVITLWNDFSRIQQLISQEASAIAFATHVRTSYPAIKNNKKITEALRSYIDFLPNNKQPRILDEEHLLELHSAYKLLNLLSNVTPKNEQEFILYSRLESKIIKGIDSKRERLSLNNQLPVPMLVILFGGGIIVLFVACIAYDIKNNLYFMLGHLAIAVFIGFYLALAIDLDTPYSLNIGYMHLSSSPYIEEIIKQLS